jgi:tellurite resistance protein TerC
MLAEIPITPWHWIGFVAAVLVFLTLDLGVFHRKAHTVKFREALSWTIVWFSLAILFATAVAPALVSDWGKEQKTEFVTGYIIELSLSMDNVFVMAIIFSYFRIPNEYQHRVLFWGVLGALIMRGLMIGVGTVLIQHINGMLYVFGAFLVFTGIKMLFSGEDGVNPETNPVVRVARKLFPISASYDGQKFVTFVDGRRVLTPLTVVLVMVETTDLVFALDSIPAIFGVTQNPFIVFTSNVFAILGLRSLYFVLAGAIEYFRYLKIGLSIILIFIGAKMLMVNWYKISTNFSLLVVAAILVMSMACSLLVAWREKRGKNSR